MPRMKRASYRHAVAWIAENDETAERDHDVIASQITVLLIADIFNVDPERVALDVIVRRENSMDPDELFLPGPAH